MRVLQNDSGNITDWDYGLSVQKGTPASVAYSARGVCIWISIRLTARHSYILGRASPLYRGDIIRTDDTTHVVVRFVDGNVVSVGPQSHLVLHRSLSKKRQAPTALLTLNRGSIQFRSSTAMLVWRASLTIRTPLAVVESRSTI